jgi:hypothetical protein
VRYTFYICNNFSNFDSCTSGKVYGFGSPLTERRLLSSLIQNFRGQIMGIHSKILVHWTGKDIENNPEANKEQKYVERLKDDCINGLFTKRTSESAIRKVKVKYLVRICFTEIRLSKAETHARRYGKLGIGFTRDFIMKKGGRPVIYIPYKPEADCCLLEDSLRNLYEKTKGNSEIRGSFKWILAHVKRMSNQKGEDYYEEMEWRLVYDESPNNKHFTKVKSGGIYRLRFAANDIKVIIFPNEKAKRISLKDETLRSYFSGHMPIMVALADCSNF